MPKTMIVSYEEWDSATVGETVSWSEFNVDLDTISMLHYIADCSAMARASVDSGGASCAIVRAAWAVDIAEFYDITIYDVDGLLCDCETGTIIYEYRG